ncbi:phage tail domain-containing protein [Kribbella italica]|uniref:Minor tail protein n=1 Tax=Kribbella italica TaxID=1540520 RepID=A0A7W9J0K4_9ACTN|nr:phage tail domain-containing protein [Kribbella italica]MBB5833408.1 hypothetical protein [Kribbella italica]
MVKLVLKSNVTGDLLDLDSLLMEDDPVYDLIPPEMRGAQALTGVTGLGLPPVSVQWIEGAGDGATFRGQRVLPRDIDLPLYFDGKDREGLKALVSRLAIMVSGECELRLVEADGTYWYCNVVRVGGGSYVYGADTIGERDLMMVITFRAGDPYWISSRDGGLTIVTEGAGRGLLNGPLTALKVRSSQAFGDVTLVNGGDAPAYPLWEITSGTNFEAISPSGQRIAWNGTLADGVTLYIDTKSGRVWDSTGANRFASVGAAPRMWTVAPGTSTAHVSMDVVDSAKARIRVTWQDRKWMVV